MQIGGILHTTNTPLDSFKGTLNRHLTADKHASLLFQQKLTTMSANGPNLLAIANLFSAAEVTVNEQSAKTACGQLRQVQAKHPKAKTTLVPALTSPPSVIVSFGGILQIDEKVGPGVGFPLHGEEEKLPPTFHLLREFPRKRLLGYFLQFPNAVVLNAVGRRNMQMSAKERQRNERKIAQAQVRKRALRAQILKNFILTWMRETFMPKYWKKQSSLERAILAWNLHSRLKVSSSLEIFILAWNFHSRPSFSLGRPLFSHHWTRIRLSWAPPCNSINNFYLGDMPRFLFFLHVS